MEDETFRWDNVIAYLVLLLSNTDSKGANKERRASHASQIQITGERNPSPGTSKTEDFFPTLTLNSTFKSWRIRIHARINKNNLAALETEESSGSNSDAWLDDSIQIRRRILNQKEETPGNPNLQICYDNDLIRLRNRLQVRDYLVIVRQAGSTVYEAFGVKGDADLGQTKSLYVRSNIGADNAVFDIDDLNTESRINLYRKAAEILTDYIEEAGLSFDADDAQIEVARQKFLDKFSMQKLATLSDDTLLQTMYYSADTENESLSYYLEFDPDLKKYFGSISGWPEYKFGLFQQKDDGQWRTGSPAHPKKLTEVEALEMGKQLREHLLNGAKVIENASLETPEEYKQLDIALKNAMGDDYTRSWMHKYYSILFPDKITAFHSQDWQRHVLYVLKVRPEQDFYSRDGQITIIRRYAGLSYYHFVCAFIDKFGGIRKFIRIGTSDENGNYAEELRASKAVGIGWNDLGPLTEFASGNSLNRKALTEALKSAYYSDPSKSAVASRKAGEISDFYDSDKDTVFVVMDGERLIALVDELGEYYFDAEKPLANRKPGTWHLCFSTDESLPHPSAGHLTTCYDFSSEMPNPDDNLLFLYDRYFNGREENEEGAMNNNNVRYEPLIYKTDYQTDFAYNRIIFGAPGTGKSYGLEKDRSRILQNDAIGGYERVTFHPDYSYAQFVGTYKPVSEGKDIYYKFVPGPFMRVYVEALKNGRTGNPQPYVLLIEEINRANVAAVFGDIFQLLDRDDDGVSQYEIETSEDIRKYLADKLGGEPGNYTKIRIPNNMFIWATMNSADQGVFPMDTAFKRRWDFTYIGVNDHDAEISGKTVILGSGSTRQRVEWNKLRKAINNYLSKKGINEDKQLGPYFLSRKIVVPESGTEIDSSRFCAVFKNKVIMYLFEDAARQKRQDLFKGCFENYNRYSEICHEFDLKGIGIFNEVIQHDTDPEDLKSQSADNHPADGEQS